MNNKTNFTIFIAYIVSESINDKNFIFFKSFMLYNKAFKNIDDN